MASALPHFLPTLLDALTLPHPAPEKLTIAGSGALPSAFAVTDLATASIAAATLAVAELLPGGPAVEVDRHLASLWFGNTILPLDWMPAPIWDAIAGDYAGRDGWIRLHTNAPHHRAAALRALGCAETREAVTAAVAGWAIDELESAVVAAGGCAAAMRSAEEWRQHPQGLAVAAEPLVAWNSRPASADWAWQPEPARPLAGLRVLDLTRILAGPVATRFLAGFGAEVLRIDPPDWDESLIPEVSLGKRCARLDLRLAADRERFGELLAGADVLVHGYRPGALAGLGFDEGWRRQANPDLIEVTLDAYGWSGPWQGRRGFDSLVQMSCGIAHSGMLWQSSPRPFPLPVQALDHATGYLMAAAVASALGRRRKGEICSARLSLARTAALLQAITPEADQGSWPGAGEGDFAVATEQTGWGPARRYRPPMSIAGAPVTWPHGAVKLGSASAEWAD